eukprot:440378-Rhodomonas_salina.1
MAAHVDDYAVIGSGWIRIEKKLRTIIATDEGGGKWGWTASAGARGESYHWGLHRNDAIFSCRAFINFRLEIGSGFRLEIGSGLLQKGTIKMQYKSS